MIRNTCLRPRAALLAALYLHLALAVLVSAQDAEATVQGEVIASQPDGGLFVQLIDVHHNVTARGDVRGDGSFELDHVPPGEYTVRVVTLTGESLYERPASVGRWTNQIEVRVPERERKPAAGSAGTVTMRQLLHPPSKKALQSFAAARKFASSGNHAGATAALERAVTESPDYAEAHINLGVQYIQAGRYQEAGAEFQRAIAIAGANAPVLCNLAWVQAVTGQRDLALESVRGALRLDQGSAQGHLILGALLAGDPRTREEGVRHLTRAAETLQSAREMLSRLAVAQRR